MLSLRDIHRRAIIAPLFAGLVAQAAFGAEGPSSPADLRAEYLTNPMGVDVPQPRFAWTLTHSGRAEVQTAYQILFATSEALLRSDRGDQWDSGKVASDDSTQVVYSGKPLESGHPYFWKVRWWDKEGRASDYSAPATFDTGFFHREDWKAQWIGGANQLRTEFELPQAPLRARAYVSGLGYYELRLNGHKVGSKVLDPAWTTYSKRVLYSVYDVTSRLRSGRNAVGAMLGEGWYRSRALLLQIEIELPDGKHFTVRSDTSWKAKNGPITSDSVYDGETYDARLETPGWDEPVFDDSGWAVAQLVTPPQGELSAETFPAIQVVDTLVPVNMWTPQPGITVYDFGQNFAGWVKLRVAGARGAEVRLRFAELLYDNGMINRDNIERAKSRDTYTLKGEGVETWEPRFTYHGFRYVEVSGFPGAPGLDSLRGRVVHSAVAPAGNFVASKQILNQIQHLIHWGQLSNLFGLPTDCDQRNERQGWMGDAHVTAEEAMLNFDMAAFYSNFVRDMRDAEKPDGEISDTVPHIYGSYPADPAWGTAYPLIVWYMWQQYGDRRILEENYDALKKYVEFLRTRAPDNLLTYSYYGDWVSIVPTPGAVVSDFYFDYDVQILANLAKILEKTNEAAAYSKLDTDIRDAFNKKFFNPETSSYSTGTQTANLLPLFLDITPEKQRGGVLWRLTTDIVYTNNTHVTTGFIGVKYLLPLLTRNGRSDLAYELAIQKTYPSWGFMVEHGATTLWELWQDKTGPAMNSHNHAMFGSLGAWFYQALAGIAQPEDSDGYRHLRIAPQVVEDLHWVSASAETVRGRVATAWTHSTGAITLEVTIPPNSDAKVYIPQEEQMTDITIGEGDRVIWEKGHFVPGTPGVTAGSKGHDDFVFDVGSGHYQFKLVGE